MFRRVAARRQAINTSVNITSKRGLARGRSGLYSKYLLVGLSQCGTCGKGFTIAASGAGSPRYGCPNSWHNGKHACDNRLTIRAKIVDSVVLEGLRHQLVQPAMLKRITEAVTAQVSQALNAHPSEREALQTRRDAVAKKLVRLVASIEHGTEGPTITEQIATREAELRQLDDDLAEGNQAPDVDIAVIPTWVRQQLQDLSGLLADNPERAKAELQRLNMRFTVSPVRDEGRPFLRVEGTGDLAALCGARDLPTTARSTAQPIAYTPLPHHLTARARSLP
jgi:hypothetical protein